MVVLVTCKNEEDPIKNEGARLQACGNTMPDLPDLVLDNTGQVLHGQVK